MSGTDYNYDDQAQFFPYFILTITSLVTIPVTYSLLKPSKELESTATRIKSEFTPEHADLIEGQRKKQKRRERRIKRFIVSVGGWAVMAYMVYLTIVTTRQIPNIWDPYDVLGVTRSASEKEIKSKYRRLSLTLHPDKRREDPAMNVTKEVINDHWVDVVKAFKALTDEEIRNNYLQYGHPDGKQSFSIGIALPKWIVTEGHGKYVLLMYALALGVILPYTVGKWWYGTQRMTRDKILVASAGKLFREYDNEQGESGVIGALSAAEEFNDVLPGQKADHGLSKLEQKVLSNTDSDAPLASALTKKDRQKIEDLEDSRRRKVLTLLWAYLGRIELDDESLNDEKFEVAPIAFRLNDAYAAITLAYSSTQAVLSSFHTSQNLIQALRPGASPLEQLPYFTPAVASAAEHRSRSRLSVQDFLRLPVSERKSRVVAPGLLTDAHFKKAMALAAQLPVLHVERAFFKVVGERFITPSSLVQFVVKGRFIPAGATKVPEVNPADLEDVDPDEGDVAAITGRKEDRSGEKPIQPPLAHAPYFPRDHAPRWHVFLADSKQGKIVVPPTAFQTFDKPIIDENGEYTYNVQTLKMQFGAPPGPGSYTFVMHMICDSYIGMDTKMEVTLVVDDPSKAEEVDEDDEISEPDEDSIAGLARSMKGDSAPKSKKRRPQEDDDSSDDGSDTDGDADSDSETDTDTDTDDE